MEVDSIHSIQEQFFQPSIYIPSHYVDRIGKAKKTILNYKSR